jgi:hypothetical protein
LAKLAWHHFQGTSNSLNFHGTILEGQAIVLNLHATILEGQAIGLNPNKKELKRRAHDLKNQDAN